MRVLNFGSLNIDYTYRVEHIAKPGETITSQTLEIFPGGKGLNQSIALAKAGAKVFHAGLIGEDGMFLKDLCQEAGADVSLIRESTVRTGNAIIQVSDEGQNSILLFSGANRQNTEEYIEEVLAHFEKEDILLLQNEINLIDVLIKKGKEKGMKVVLNPSPFDEHIGECDLSKVDLFFLNEVEGEQITGEKEFIAILAKMNERFPEAEVVLTVGAKGAYYSDGKTKVFQESFPVQAVDTTAAGDTFTGFFLAAAIEGATGEEALRRAAKASSIAVSRKGASVSVPTKEEVDDQLGTGDF